MRKTASWGQPLTVNRLHDSHDGEKCLHHGGAGNRWASQAIRHAMTHRHARRCRKTYIPLKTKNDERLRKKTIKYLQKRKKCIIFAPLTV